MKAFRIVRDYGRSGFPRLALPVAHRPRLAAHVTDGYAMGANSKHALAEAEHGAIYRTEAEARDSITELA